MLFLAKLLWRRNVVRLSWLLHKSALEFVRSFVRMSMIALHVRARFMQPGDCAIIQVDQSSYPMRWREQGTVSY